MKYKCKYCGVSLKSEDSLISHSCEIKRRMLVERNKENRLAFSLWMKFHKFCIPHSKVEKTYFDFIKSKYYNSFLAFAEYVIRIKPLSVDEFFDFLIRNSVKLNNWCSEWVYATWVKEVCKKETADRAV
jgi:hypothetical protein